MIEYSFIYDVFAWNNIAKVPEVVDDKERERIKNHIIEEALELQQADNKKDRVDALVDSMWVIVNALRAEFDGDITKVVDALETVAEANFGKFFEYKDRENQLAYAKEQGYPNPYIEEYFGEDDDVDLCCIKDETGKVRKPNGWTEPDWSWLD